MLNDRSEKKDRLASAIAGLKNDLTEESVFEMVVASGQCLRQGSGLVWSEIEEIIAEELKE